MWTGIGFGAAVLVGVVLALLVAARREPGEEPMPWNLADLARLQASIMAMLGSVSITGIVIIVGFLTNREGLSAAGALDRVAVMFAIAFSFFMQTAFTLSYLPDRAVVGERLFRLHYALSSTLQYRTVLLLVCALISFGAFIGLSLTLQVMIWFVPLMVAGVFLIIASVSDALGLVRFGECCLAALLGLFLGAAFYAVMRWQGVVEPHATLVVALAFAVANGLSTVAGGLVSMTPRRPRLQALLTRYARALAAIDMQTTVISLVFLWLAVAGVV